MKKRCVGLLIAALVLAQPVSAYAAGSTSTKPVISRGSGSGSASSKGGSYKPMTTNDAISISLPGTTTGAAGTAGTAGGTVTIGNSVVSFVSPESAGLSAKTVETINTINAGTTPLYRIIGTTNVVGYSALAPVQILAAADVTTGQPSKEPVALSMYVPNLVQGLGDIQILAYNETNKAWELMAPAGIDYATKQITVNVADGTPFTVVYKK